MNTRSDIKRQGLRLKESYFPYTVQPVAVGISSVPLNSDVQSVLSALKFPPISEAILGLAKFRSNTEDLSEFYESTDGNISDMDDKQLDVANRIASFTERVEEIDGELNETQRILSDIILQGRDTRPEGHDVTCSCSDCSVVKRVASLNDKLTALADLKQAKLQLIARLREQEGGLRSDINNFNGNQSLTDGDEGSHLTAHPAHTAQSDGMNDYITNHANDQAQKQHGPQINNDQMQQGLNKHLQFDDDLSSDKGEDETDGDKQNSPCPPIKRSQLSDNANSASLNEHDDERPQYNTPIQGCTKGIPGRQHYNTQIPGAITPVASSTPFDDTAKKPHHNNAPNTPKDCADLLMKIMDDNNSHYLQSVNQFSTALNLLQKHIDNQQQHMIKSCKNDMSLRAAAGSARTLIKPSVPTPPRFSGKAGEDFSLFKAAMDDYFQLAPMDDGQKISFVSLLLSGPAYRLVAETSESNKNTYDKVMSLLDRGFGPATKQEECLSRLVNRKQGSNESLYEYYNDILSHLAQCDMSEAMKKVFFINGLKPDLRKSVTIAQPQSIQAAFTLANVLQAQEGEKVVKLNEIQAQLGAPRPQNDLASHSYTNNAQVYNDQSVNSHLNKRCYLCGSLNHLRRSCPHLSSVRGRGRNLPHNGNRQFATDTTNATPHEMRGQTNGGVYQRFPGPHNVQRPGAGSLPYCRSCGTAHAWGRHINRDINPRVTLIESNEEVATNESYKYDHLN